MARKKGKKKLFIVLAISVVLILVVVAVMVVKSHSTTKSTDTSEATKKDTPAIPDEANSTDKSTTPTDSSTDATVDSANVTTADIEPMTIIVSYMKGIGGFDFQVLRTPSGTKYVEFSSTKLIGTKCTNDTGTFASIVENPSSDESATLAKKTTINGTTYGLSLADSTCTSDATLLKQYQDAFSEPFSLLKKM